MNIRSENEAFTRAELKGKLMMALCRSQSMGRRHLPQRE